MSADFATAISLGATHVRVGSAIFGERDKARAMSELPPEIRTMATALCGAGYLFGTEPNAFLKVAGASAAEKRGSALAIADGEGRNGVFLAEQGLDVLSVDFSPAGQDKARALAKATRRFAARSCKPT